MKRLTEGNRDRCDFCAANDDGLCILPDTFPCTDYKIYYRLADIEDILGNEYDLDRLRGLIKADTVERCWIRQG